MAIAGITVQTSPEAYDAVYGRMHVAEGVVQMQETGVPCTLVAVLEIGADRLEDTLAALSGWEGVLNVGLVSISYEDEVETRGYIPCPVHKPRKGGTACFGERPNPLTHPGLAPGLSRSAFQPVVSGSVPEGD